MPTESIQKQVVVASLGSEGLKAGKGSSASETGTAQSLPPDTELTAGDGVGTVEAGKVEGKAALEKTGVYNVQGEEKHQAPNDLKVLNEMTGIMVAGEEGDLDKQVGKFLSPEQKRAAKKEFSLDALTKKEQADTQSRWGNYVQSIKIGASGSDVNALVMWVLREAYLSSNEDLKFYAEKVTFYNAVKDKLRKKIREAQDVMHQAAGRGDTEAVDDKIDELGFKMQDYFVDGVSTDTVDANGRPVIDPTDVRSKYSATDGVIEPKQEGATEETKVTTPKVSKKAFLDYIADLEQNLNGVGDDAQLANVDLQNQLQKQQQTMQMLSNISKMLHDTALAIIRKIGG
jgi:hypothetical protein